ARAGASVGPTRPRGARTWWSTSCSPPRAWRARRWGWRPWSTRRGRTPPPRWRWPPASTCCSPAPRPRPRPAEGAWAGAGVRQTAGRRSAAGDDHQQALHVGLGAEALADLDLEALGLEERRHDGVHVDQHVVVALLLAPVAAVGFAHEAREDAGEVVGTVADPLDHQGPVVAQPPRRRAGHLGVA